MIDELKLKFSWMLIVIDDPSFLLAKSISDVIYLIFKNINFKYIILDHIYGAKTASLIENKNKVLTLDDFFKLMEGVDSFDWGDFFLFFNDPKNWKNPREEPYPTIISQTNTTIRAVDNQYIYIYTPFKEIFELINKNYKIESVKRGTLEELDYPE